MERNFNEWLSNFKTSISGYDYYADFKKIHSNVDAIRIELSLMGSLIGSTKIEEDFKVLVEQYPNVLKCIPTLLAVRGKEIEATDDNGSYVYNFRGKIQSVEQYCYFMRETGLFDLLSNHIVSNLVDYATGVETGLDSNGRKNRGGHVMENLVEAYLKDAGFTLGHNYFKEMRLSVIESKFGVNLAAISNSGKTEKRFDFVVVNNDNIYAIETNFYKGGGSKLNETARSYKNLAIEARTIPNFHFVWFTDGRGWKSARHNLEETFDVMEHIYSISDLESGIVKQVFV